MVTDDIITSGDGKKTEITLIEGEELDTVMLHDKEVAMAVVKRDAIYFYNSIAVEIADKCGSLILMKPNDISSDCYDISLE